MNKKVDIYNYGESEKAIVVFFEPHREVELTSSDYYLTHEALSRVLETLGYDVKIVECEDDIE